MRAETDIQWTLVARTDLDTLFSGLETRGQALSWPLSLSCGQRERLPPISEEVQPIQSMGSCIYSNREKQAERSLFWSTYSDNTRTKIVGGLYISQFLGGCVHEIAACEAALHELRKLFDAAYVECIVLTVEDDLAFDVAPALCGVYRPDLWEDRGDDDSIHANFRTTSNWLEISPSELNSDILSFDELSATTQAWLRSAQKCLEREFWSS